MLTKLVHLDKNFTAFKSTIQDKHKETDQEMERVGEDLQYLKGPFMT